MSSRIGQMTEMGPESPRVQTRPDRNPRMKIRAEVDQDVWKQ